MTCKALWQELTQLLAKNRIRLPANSRQRHSHNSRINRSDVPDFERKIYQPARKLTNADMISGFSHGNSEFIPQLTHQADHH